MARRKGTTYKTTTTRSYRLAYAMPYMWTTVC